MTNPDQYKIMPDTITCGIKPTFSKKRLTELLQARIEHHEELRRQFVVSAPKAMEAFTKRCKELENKRPTEKDQEELQQLQMVHMSSAFQLELHEKWAAFLGFQKDHLNEGTHVLELNDLKILDLVEFPSEAGQSFMPMQARQPKPMLPTPYSAMGF